MSDQPNDLQLPDPADVDWDAELENLPRHEILIDIAYRRARGLVDQWFMLRAGDAIGFDDMPPELRLRPDELIGVIVVDQFAEAACRAVGVEYHELDDDQGQELVEAVLGCITQGVSIGLGAMPDNDNDDETEEYR